ncbi:hypothetical protein H5410_001542 [Solanum commersonii]|uniref:Uncharacterized protein n=1 Tax=Solanum commersonii TaxID=4109 RepID=A0A9J6AZH6_SOLCO|nr:hypothetical protein H5410_001542 [Solanum commersonii]
MTFKKINSKFASSSVSASACTSGSTSPSAKTDGSKSHAKATKEDISEMVERYLAQLSLSTSRKSFASDDNDILRTGSTPHNMFASHVWENKCYSPSPMIVMHMIMVETSTIEDCKFDKSS